MMIFRRIRKSFRERHEVKLRDLETPRESFLMKYKNVRGVEVEICIAYRVTDLNRKS